MFNLIKHIRFIGLGLLVWPMLAISASSTTQSTHSLAPMLKEAMPSVVHITVVRFDKAPRKDGAPNHSMELDAHRVATLGSGVIVNAEKGYILTNMHVVEDAEEVLITLSDGRHTQAKLIGGDPESDVAVIQIPEKNLKALPFADSDQLAVGDFVVAIGNPFGLSQTVTSGIISALGRTDLGLEGYEDFIQTDAPINVGNSGGALVNMQGQLIGINTAILSKDGGSLGIGFAIPINMARNIANQLVQYGQVRRGLLGIVAQNLTPEFKTSFKTTASQGAIITQVMAESPAATAGLKPGDIVLNLNDRPITSASQLRNNLGLIPIGQKAKLQIERLGKTQVVTLTMVDPRKHVSAIAQIYPQLDGLELGPVDTTIATHGQVKGLQVLSVAYGSPAWRTGIRKRDIIVEANHQAVDSLASFKKAASSSKTQLLLRVLRGAGANYIVIQRPAETGKPKT